MTRFKRGLLAGALLAASATAAWAATVNGVTNGDFETGTTAGWTYSCPGSGVALSGGLGASDLGINSGSTWAFVNSQGQASADCDLYQDVAVPAAATAASLQMRYALTGSNASNGLELRRIDVTTTAGAVLVNIQPAVNRATTRAFAPLASPVNLLAYAGQTVRIRARVTNTGNPSGSANVIGLDDVVLNITTPDPVPTLSEWALILLSVLLAGGAAVVLQRRSALTPR